MTAILGGGIGGLSAAFYALENPKFGALTLLEASNRLGGWIYTHRTPNGLIFEKGPRTLRSTGSNANHTLDLIDNINLTDSIIPIPSNHPAAKRRMIYVDKKLHTLPASFFDLFKIKTPLRKPLISALWKDFRAPQVISDDESTYSFVERRLGKDIADYLVSAILCGICAGDAKKISVNFLMESLFKAEQKHGSIWKGNIRNMEEDRMKQAKEKSLQVKNNAKSTITSAERAKRENWAVYSLQNGLEELPKKLGEYLSAKNVNINLNERCDNITFESDHVKLEVNGKIKKFSRIISSLPVKQLSRLVKHQHPELASELDGIPSVTVGVVNCYFPINVFSDEAFGFLIPPNQNLPILGVIFDSYMFPQGPGSVLTVLMGGAWFEHYFGENPTKEHLLSVAIENLKTTLNTKIDPVEVDVSILKDCIPQYIVGHKQRINRIKNYISSRGIPLTLCGSSCQGVGINDVILSAKNAIDDIAHIE